MKKLAMGIGCGVLALGLSVVEPRPLLIGFWMLTGWIWFTSETLLKVRVNMAGVATAAVCFMGAAALGHRLCTWIYAQFSAPTDSDTVKLPAGKWRWRWTLKGLSLVVLMFATGLCTVGLTHQIAWMLTSDEPTFELDSSISFRHRHDQLQ